MRFFVVVLLLVSGLSSLAIAADPARGQQVEQLFQSESDPARKLGYLLYLPENYGSSNEPVPLLLFLHGSGERGEDLSLVKKHGPPKLLDRGWRPSLIVVSPQCPAEHRWDAQTLLALLNHLGENLLVDRERVYVTGLSMGGSGTWSLVAADPDRFAAAVPICGRADPWMATSAARIPIWVVVGDRDRSSLVGNCLGMVNSLQARSGDVKFTVYSGVGHDSWTQTYATPELYEWMLRHKASDRTTSAQ